MITLGVDDVAAAATFYETGLGLPRFAVPSDEVAFFDLAGTWLGLFGRAALAEDAGVADAGVAAESAPFGGFALAHNLASEAEVDALFKEALAAGATVTKAPQKTEWGGYSGYFRDLDGHLWEVAHNPHFWVGPPDTES